MIISKTPLRISFAGGGSDIPSFCNKYQGICVNSAINKYVYVLVTRRFDRKIYLKYSENEIVEDVENIKHDFIRETLKFLNIDFGIEIINWADIPTKGTGLGSSSAFLVGLLNALHTLKGDQVSASQLAEEACYIEIELCKKPIGYQDQFACAIGGLNKFMFEGSYTNTKCVRITNNYEDLETISNNLMMFYTGATRDSGLILDEQSKSLATEKNKIESMKKNVRLASKLQDRLSHGKHYDELGNFMHENWLLKKEFQKNITNDLINEMYDTAMANGALGGKITGAGGGGFLVLYVPASCRENVCYELMDLNDQIKFMPVVLEKYGTRIMSNVENYKW